MGRYRGMIESWDVLNEVLAGYGPVRREDGLRETPWLAALGPGYLDLAFRLAHEADPRAVLTWNEDSLEHDFGWVEARRARVLARLEAMRKRGVPVRRFGIQAHSSATTRSTRRSSAVSCGSSASSASASRSPNSISMTRPSPPIRWHGTRAWRISPAASSMSRSMSPRSSMS